MNDARRIEASLAKLVQMILFRDQPLLMRIVLNFVLGLLQLSCGFFFADVVGLFLWVVIKNV